MDDPYTKREIDMIHIGLDEKMDLMLEKQDYTNGKVKKIIIGLVAVAAFSAGLGLKEMPFIISFFV
jgi:hypothetical protein